MPANWSERAAAVIGAGIAAVITAGCSARQPAVPKSTAQPISMAALHRAGGVPPGWQLSVPRGDVAAGRRAFGELGCGSCHHIDGEQFGDVGPRGAGPDLSGMGSHHPAAYFLESILNPNAVLVDGPGYVGPDGRSTMPAYRDMTLGQLADIVTYLQSLRGPAVHHHAHWAASSFLVQVDELSADDFDALENWFAARGAETLNGVDGFASVETYVARTPAGRLVVSIYGFEDDAVLHDFAERLDNPQQRQTLGLPAADPRRFRATPVYKYALMCVP